MVDVYFRPAFVERGAGGEGGGEEGEEEAAEGRANKSGIPPPWKTMEGKGGEDGVEISKAFPFLCLARDDTTRKRIDLSLDSILFSRV